MPIFVDYNCKKKIDAYLVTMAAIRNQDHWMSDILYPMYVDL